MNCPAFEQLIDYLDGRLVAATAETVAAHLAGGCSDCAAARAWYESVATTARADESVEPPQWLVKRAIKIFDGTRSRGALSKRLGNILATLAYDSFARPALAGARAAETADHQLLYTAADYKIDLLLASSDHGTNMTGQILRESEYLFESTAGIPLALVVGGKLVHETNTNDVGEFTIPAIDGGRYDLRIETGEVSITVVGLTIV
jgi:hypothetical protein